MKTKSFFLSCIAFLLLASCDLVENPIIPQGTYRHDLYGPAPTFSQPEVVQNVLLEDFTGHVCGYCPIGHQTAATLLENHEDRIAVVAIHAGSLAEPLPPDYPANWVTSEGTYYLLTQVGVDEMPKGRANRLPSANVAFSPSLWTAKVSEALATIPQVGLQLQASYSEDNAHLNVHVNSHWFSSATGDYRLVILVTESGIIAPQLWYGHDPEYVPEYEHNHMLRGSLSGATGTVVATNPTAGQNKTNSYTVDWNTEWIPENVEVVAFITEGETGKVLNVAKQHLVE